MTDQVERNSDHSVMLSDLGWQGDVKCLVCQNCNWRYLVEMNHLLELCPHCHIGQLEEYQDNDFSMLADFLRPAELLLPFSVPHSTVVSGIQNFAKKVPFAPDDLSLGNLQNRLRKIFVPLWLVDSQVAANWQADCGYYYQAKSHQEKYSGGSWQTQEVIETRTRWEPRLGRLSRTYQNITAPALEDHHRLMAALGNYDFKKASVAGANVLFNDKSNLPIIAIPTRDKDDAWPDALPRFQEQAGEESRQACAADQIREFKWEPQFSLQNWTLFLLPLYTSYYLDDEKKPQSILVNGQSGQMSGSRRASMNKAKKVSMYILIAAMIIFALTVAAGLLSMLVPGLMALAGIGLVFAIIVALAAIYPIATVWSMNRKE